MLIITGRNSTAVIVWEVSGENLLRNYMPRKVGLLMLVLNKVVLFCVEKELKLIC